MKLLCSIHIFSRDQGGYSAEIGLPGEAQPTVQSSEVISDHLTTLLERIKRQVKAMLGVKG